MHNTALVFGLTLFLPRNIFVCVHSIPALILCCLTILTLTSNVVPMSLLKIVKTIQAAMLLGLRHLVFCLK